MKSVTEGLEVFQTDFENALNSIRRQGVLSEYLKQIPCIYPFVSSCDTKHSSQRTIKSEYGVQKGDPLGPLLFSLALIPLINKIKQKVPMLLTNFCCLDNGILAGTEAELMHSLDIFESEGKDLGFNVKTSKVCCGCPKS